MSDNKNGTNNGGEKKTVKQKIGEFFHSDGVKKAGKIAVKVAEGAAFVTTLIGAGFTLKKSIGGKKYFDISSDRSDDIFMESKDVTDET